MRVLHWNIHSWRDAGGAPNHAAVERLISQTAPDAVSLVEVSESWGAPSQLAGLAERLSYHWVFVPALEFGGDPPSTGYGNALLTTRPVLAIQQWRIHTPARYENTEPSEPRTAVCARVEANGGPDGRAGLDGPVWVLSTHLPASRASDRSRALTRFATLLRQLDGPWLACGDFNTPASAWLGELPGVTFCPDPPRPTFPGSPAGPLHRLLSRLARGAGRGQGAAGPRLGPPRRAGVGSMARSRGAGHGRSGAARQNPEAPAPSLGALGGAPGQDWRSLAAMARSSSACARPNSESSRPASMRDSSRTRPG